MDVFQISVLNGIAVCTFDTSIYIFSIYFTWVSFTDTTGVQLELFWSMTLQSIWLMRMWSAGWRSCGITRITTLSSCWWATRAIWGISGLFPLMRPELLQVSISSCIFMLFSEKRSTWGVKLSLILCYTEKNSLSFIETSALDSTNVEEAFKNILTGGSWS